LVVGVDDDDDGGGDDDYHHQDRLEYPKGLSETERAEAAKKLQALPSDLAQQVLDELAGRMKAGSIRIAPLAYLRGLVERARTGKFTPDIALQVADGREHRRQVEAARRRAEAAHRAALERHGHTVMEYSDNPLVRRLNAIRDRSDSAGGGGD